MNKFLTRLVEANEEPKLRGISEANRALYIAGMKILAAIVSEEFFDIDRSSADLDKVMQIEGLYYELPYYDASAIYFDGHSIDLVYLHVVARGENGNKYIQCPLRIDFRVSNSKDYKISVIWQSGARPIRKVLYGCEDGGYYTEIDDPATVTLTELFER